MKTIGVLMSFSSLFPFAVLAFQSPPQLKPFAQEEFMKTLEKAGPQLTSRLKGDWIGLYRYITCMYLFFLFSLHVRWKRIQTQAFLWF